MIVALVALFVSLAGNAGAVTYFVTSKQIKDHTIQLRDISYGMQFALQGSQGPRGFTGPQGFTGPRGFTGPQGPTGPAGRSYDPFQLEQDMRKLCQAVGQIQKNAVTTQPYTYWYPDFRYSACSYYYN